MEVTGLNNIEEFKRLLRTRKWIIVTPRALLAIALGIGRLEEEDYKTLTWVVGSSNEKSVNEVRNRIFLVGKNEKIMSFIKSILNNNISEEILSKMIALDIDLFTNSARIACPKDDEELELMIRKLEEDMYTFTNYLLSLYND
ncbi:MAG: hypothetical protein HA495_03785 [Thaumarchaeota archaeon]|nr:hypothetical protein [Nitrososphaerota archaeon]